MISYIAHHKNLSMDQTEATLYPKLPVIYNKIMQLGLGILLLVAILTVWLFGKVQVNEDIDRHYGEMTRVYAQKVGSALSVMLDSEQMSLVEKYLVDLESQALVEHVRFYDAKGKLLWHSEQSQDMTEISLQGSNDIVLRNDNRPLIYVEEVRNQKLQGYIRISLNQQMLSSEAKQSADNHYNYFRVLLLIAGIAGFLFARGIRFRVVKLNKKHGHSDSGFSHSR